MPAALAQWNVMATIWTGHRHMLLRRGMATARKKNHYEVLGVGRRASVKQIKSAYFKLSKKHHPDRASGDSVKFHEISAAYEVLGNRHQRRAYDSGLDGDEPHYGHRAPRTSAPRGHGKIYTGRSAQFDYDAWSESHYAEVRQREVKSRAEYRIAAEKRIERMEERKRGVVACILIVGMAVYISMLDSSGGRAPAPPARPPS